MSKQTVVEWLEQALEGTILTHEQIMQIIGLFEQAKEMHKQEIIDDCNQIEVIELDHELPGEKYYNQTFNK